MYFLPHDISSMLADTDTTEIDQTLDQNIRDLTPRIAAKKNEYRHFGPYWWWVKPLLRKSPGARRSWLKGGYRDRHFLDSLDPNILDPHLLNHPGFSAGDPAPQTTNGQETNRDRQLAWLGFQYYHAEIVDDTPAGFHIVQTGHRRVLAYTVYDADASEQLPLFTDPESKDTTVTEFLSDPTRYTGSAWFQRAEEYAAADTPHKAAAALRRAIQRAIDTSDRTRAWIRLGQLYQDNNHIQKALFCYHNAYQKDQEGWIQGLMADAWLQDNDPHQALQCYQAALQTMPGNPEYQAGLERTRRLLTQHGPAHGTYQLQPDRIAR